MLINHFILLLKVILSSVIIRMKRLYSNVQRQIKQEPEAQNLHEMIAGVHLVYHGLVSVSISVWENDMSA